MVSCSRVTTAERLIECATVRAATAVTPTRAANSSSSATRVPVPDSLVEKKRERSTIAAKSATEAAATTVWPRALSSRPASLSTGTTRPSEVADRATASSTGLLTQPAASSPPPTASPSASVTA